MQQERTTAPTVLCECCSIPSAASSGAAANRTFADLIRYMLGGAIGLVAWFILYLSLAPASRWLTYDLLRLGRGRHLSAAVEFFVFEVPKVLLLLTLVVFSVGVVAAGILMVGFLFNLIM